MLSPVTCRIVAVLALQACVPLGRAMIPDPATRWVTGPTEVGLLDVSGPRCAGGTLVVRVMAVVGSSSCNRAGEVRAFVDADRRQVTVSGTVDTQVSDAPLGCTADFGVKTSTLSVVLPQPGTWSFVAERHSAALGGPDGTAAARLGVEIAESCAGRGDESARPLD